MRLPTGFTRLLKLAVRPRAVEQDVDDELRFHLEMRAEKLQREGLSPAEAREAARREFGDVERVRAECVRLGHERETEMKRSLFLDALVQDVRYALRTLRKAPAFSLVAVLTLALGIGATTALFSVVRGVLLKPLPFPAPERLVRLWQASPSLDQPRAAISQNDFEDWKARQRSFSALGGWWHVEDMTGVDLSGLGDPERIRATFVTDGFFSSLGMAPQLGRALLPEENVPGQDAVVVLGHGFWTRRFGADPSLVGRTVTLDGVPHTVVGVMPPSFTFPSEQMDVWLPLSRIPESGIPRVRLNRFLSVVGRLQPGVTLETARSELGGIARQLAEVHAESNGQYTAITAIPLHEAITGDVRTSLLVVLGAVGLLLLIACVNVANLQLARATLRERELAVRAALGAGPGRLVCQLLTESLVLATLGGFLGVGLAVWGTEALVGLSVDQLPRLREVRVDDEVLAFAAGATLLTGLLFGLLPALRASTPKLEPVLKAGGRGTVSHRGARLRGGLVVAEVAVAVVLATGAGLATRSLSRMLSEDPGFRAEGAAVVSFTVSKEKRPQRRQYLAEVLERVRAVPGVQSAALVKNLPLEGSGEDIAFARPDHPEDVVNPPHLQMMHVSTDYFRTLGIPLLGGRVLEATDTEDAPAVAVVSQTFARRYFAGEDPVGKTLRLGTSEHTIVGVVGDVRQAGLAEPAPPLIYLHVLQNTRSVLNLVVRGQGALLPLAASARQAIWSVHPGQTISRITTLEEVVSEAVTRPRLLSVMLGLFAVLGMALAAVGIYGVLAYTVSQRQREMGVRLALGAKPADVLRLVLRSGMALAGTGVALGVAGALGLSWVMRSILYGVAPHDPLTFAGVMALLLGVALVACLIPARRAMRVDPAVTLRGE
ncbi:ABC transporter permease [Pyxidicoccus fallax]|uniref:ABC transporter permease n=1 Tax=Pyxidicoccus fallax TaxID=394095 RepID=A0A848LER4_9BACT|nr:ABC transporter permease [Pyxidicoccus fallax]NMO14751.1 ABC transporter permease [Pyxidicoccus fallax]NPC82356.1 ABC transporter permease [Pyxidicoccus fallax]